MTKWIRGPAVFLLAATLLAGSGADEATAATKGKAGATTASRPAAKSSKTTSAKPGAKPSKTSPAKPAAKSSKQTPAKAAKPAPSKAAKPAAPRPAKPAIVQPEKPAAVIPKAAPKPDAATDGLPADPTKPIPAGTFKKGRLSFRLRFRGVDSPYKTMSAFVMPGEVLEIEASGGSGLFAGSSRTGVLVADAKKPIWRWTAPAEHGDHEIRIRDRGKGRTDVATLHVFVLRPYDGGETIDGYPIGTYSPPPKKQSEAFTQPRGFVEVTAGNRDTPVSPHFELGQFVGKEKVEGSHYIALSPALLIKLELVLEELAKRGLAAATLEVLSGFRTPAYNARIGNETSLSRHLYGDAADVFLDRDGDHEMDDLDGDGLVTKEDAVVLHDLIDQVVDAGKEAKALAGGLSTYQATPTHGPFVHIDTRGVRVRW